MIIKEVEEFHRFSVKLLLANTKTKLFFNEQEFKDNYGKLMILAGLRSAIDKQVKSIT